MSRRRGVLKFVPSREPRSDAPYPHISGELTADASELEAETCAMMVAEVCVVRDVWSVLRRPTYE